MTGAAGARPLLSIVTINCNNAAGLSRTLESFAPWRGLEGLEFVFVDGGSTDDSMAIAARFYRASEMRSEPDTGIYQAMNKGLRRSTAHYVIWINSGDVLSGDLQPLMEYFRHDYGLIAFAVEIARADGCVEKTLFPSLDGMPDAMIVHQGMALNRNTLLAFGGYDERWRLTADFDVLLRLFLARIPMLCVPRVISRFFLGGITSDWHAVARERLDILRANRAIGRRLYGARWLRLRAELLALRLRGLAARLFRGRSS